MQTEWFIALAPFSCITRANYEIWESIYANKLNYPHFTGDVGHPLGKVVDMLFAGSVLSQGHRLAELHRH